MAGRGGISPANVGEVGEEREAGFEKSNPGPLGRGREQEREESGRGERGARAGVVDVARRRRRRGRGGGFGCGGCGRGVGRRKGKDLTGGPHLSATPGEEGGGRPGWASACGRPSKGEGEGKGRMGRRPIRKKKGGKREGKEKEKGKSIFPGITILLAQF